MNNKELIKLNKLVQKFRTMTLNLLNEKELSKLNKEDIALITENLEIISTIAYLNLYKTLFIKDLKSNKLK